MRDIPPKAAKQIGQNIYRYRVRKQLSQDELARLSNINQAYLSGLENGKRNPSINVLERIASSLDVTIEDLVGKPH